MHLLSGNKNVQNQTDAEVEAHIIENELENPTQTTK